MRAFARTTLPALSGASAAKTEVLPEWNLTDLYTSPESHDVRDDMDSVLTRSKAFEEAFRGKLSADADLISKAVADYEALQDTLGRLISFAGLTYAGDTSDPARGKFYGDVQERITAASSHLLFFELELNQLSDADIEALCRDDRIAHYEPWLTDIRKEKPYQLSEDVERLFHEKSVTGRGAWNRLFDETVTSLSFDVDGETLAIEPTLNFLQDQDGKKREAAARALGQTFSKNIRTFTLITNTLAKDKEISDRWRGFEDIASSRHLANRVEPEVVDALVSSVRNAYPKLSHRYYQMKARWFGADAMDYWDRNAPLPSVEQKNYPWSEAQSTVLDAYGGFSPKMREIAEVFFDKNWIDAPVRPGKSPGAFSHPTVPSAHPYVLLNYQGKPRDVMTLAHELGHGVHQVLASEQGPLMAPTPLTLAETASVFGEMLTFKAILKATTDPVRRKALLASKVEDMINTVIRQIAFYTFERDVHTARRESELTADTLGDIWMKVQGESLGPAIRLDDDYRTFWAYIPHFIHSPFYVYAYAFGDCLVNSLYAVYENADDGFQQKYFDMLSAGGTKHHSELLAPFGLDASDAGFWSKGLGVIEALIDELEAIDASLSPE
ncbi:MAG: M3 family oligoendopeptidase [Pseudomonadota bacterium]